MREKICRACQLPREGAVGIVFPPLGEGGNSQSLTCGNAFLPRYWKVLPCNYFLYVCT